ncbi:hypothetical protein THICB2_400035 [Thiomonas sp. CB2]|nr:hypothetical protein THICB2_400035 [Thiomonas sp. CB2]VDY07969.1 protein of unknown function [Thiomonas sp. Sup16B3]VDY17681.1 protein of unknown function [Thiomonas sp. CB2]
MLYMAVWFLLYGQLESATGAFMHWLTGATGLRQPVISTARSAFSPSKCPRC